MPKRRVRILAAVCHVIALHSHAARGCPVYVPDPICSEDSFSFANGTRKLESTDLALAERRLAEGDIGPALSALRRIDLLPFLYQGDTNFEATKERLATALRAKAADDPRIAALEALATTKGESQVARLSAIHAAAPDSAEVADLFAEALRRNNRPLSARELLESFLAAHPRDPAALHALLEREWVDERSARAHELATRWRALEPSNPSALLHEFVTAATVEPDPDIEGRVAELARTFGDPKLLLEACNALAFHREDRCLLAVHDVLDWRDTPDAARIRILAALFSHDETGAISRLVAMESDPERRTTLLRPFAEGIGGMLGCSESSVLARPVSDPDVRRRLLAAACAPPVDPNAAFLAALDEGKTDRALQLGWRIREHDDESRALGAVRARLEVSPDDSRLWSLLASMTSPEPVRREQVLKAWAAAIPADDKPWRELADTALNGNRMVAAAGRFRAALARTVPEQRSSYASDWLDRLIWSAEHADFEGFVHDVEGAVPASAELDSIVLLAQAQAARAAGRSEAALAFLRDVHDEEDWRFEELEGQLLAELGRENELVARLRDESEGEPGELWPLEVARMAANRGLAQLARENYRLVLERDPGDPKLWSELATVESQDGRRAAAIDAYERALGSAPESAEIRGALAELFVEESRWQEAFATLTEHSGAEETLGGELVQLARAARRADERFLAAEALERAEFHHPDAFDARFERAALDAAEASTSSTRERFIALDQELRRGFPDCIGLCDPDQLREEARYVLAHGLLPPPDSTLAAALDTSNR